MKEYYIAYEYREWHLKGIKIHNDITVNLHPWTFVLTDKKLIFKPYKKLAASSNRYYFIIFCSIEVLLSRIIIENFQKNTNITTIYNQY